MTSMWQDNVGRVLVKGSSSMGAAEDSADVDEAEDANCVFHKFWIVGLVCKFVIFTSPIMVHQLPKEKLSSAKYSLDCANLAHDYKEAVTYNLRRNKLQSSQHVAEVGLADFTSPMFVLLIWCNNCRCARWLRNSQVLHMKGQIDVGLGVIEQFMQRRLFCGLWEPGWSTNCHHAAANATGCQGEVRCCGLGTYASHRLHWPTQDGEVGSAGTSRSLRLVLQSFDIESWFQHLSSLVLLFNCSKQIHSFSMCCSKVQFSLWHLF